MKAPQPAARRLLSFDACMDLGKEFFLTDKDESEAKRQSWAHLPVSRDPLILYHMPFLLRLTLVPVSSLRAEETRSFVVTATSGSGGLVALQGWGCAFPRKSFCKSSVT